MHKINDTLDFCMDLGNIVGDLPKSPGIPGRLPAYKTDWSYMVNIMIINSDIALTIPLIYDIFLHICISFDSLDKPNLISRNNYHIETVLLVYLRNLTGWKPVLFSNVGPRRVRPRRVMIVTRMPFPITRNHDMIIDISSIQFRFCY